MAEWSNSTDQTVNPGESIVFSTTVSPVQNGNVFHRDNTGEFLLSGGPRRNGCCCCTRNNNTKEVLTYFGANIAIPEGGTVGAISVAIAVDGATVPFTTMTETPAAVNEFSNVSRVATIPIFRGCCQSVTIRNISDQPIIVNNPNFGIPENGGIR